MSPEVPPGMDPYELVAVIGSDECPEEVRRMFGLVYPGAQVVKHADGKAAKCWRCEKGPEQTGIGLCHACLAELREDARAEWRSGSASGS